MFGSNVAARSEGQATITAR